MKRYKEDEIKARLSEEYDKVSKLYELYINASKYIEIDEVFRSTKDTIVEVLDIDALGIYLYNERKDRLISKCIFGLSDELQEYIKELRVVNELTGKILENKKPLFFNIDNYPETIYKKFSIKEGIKNIGIFPIIYEDDVIGLMYIANKRDNKTYFHNKEVVLEFCNRFSGVIRNSLSYNSLKDELNKKNENEIELIKEKNEVEESKKIVEKNFTILDSILGNIDALVWKLDQNGKVVMINGKVLDYLAVKKEEVIGKSVYDFECYFGKAIKYVEQALKGKDCEYEGCYRKHFFHIKYTSMKDAEGDLIGVVGLAIDITNRKNMEKKIVEIETKFKLASEGARIGWWHWDIKNDDLVVDDNVAKFVGYNLEELTPLTPTIWNRFIDDAYVEKSKKILKKHFNGQTEYYECELKVKHRDGSIKWILNRGKTIERGKNNEPIRMSGVYIDITDIKEAEDIKLLWGKKEYEEKIRNEFFANISHELRTPINVIYSAVQLEDKYIDILDKDQILKYNKTIKQNCFRLIKITNNIIDITRLETGFFNPICKVENIVNLIEDITLSIISYAHMKNIKVTFDTEEEEVFVKCDSILIERIILNLLSNAVKYGKDSGSIEVGIRKEDEGMIRISIKDDGIGIPKNLQDKVFERFQRVDNGFSRSKEGSGIGLSIVKSLVELQGGTIELNSDINEGTEFIIKFKTEDVTQIMYEGNALSDESNIIDKVDVEFSDIYF